MLQHHLNRSYHYFIYAAQTVQRPEQRRGSVPTADGRRLKDVLQLFTTLFREASSRWRPGSAYISPCSMSNLRYYLESQVYSVPSLA